MNAAVDESRILVAEDQEHVREALSMLLRAHGYSVTLCASPQEAICAAQTQTPDLALVDMNYRRDSTSGLEGLDLIQRLREFDGTIPIIALTAWGNVDLAVNAMKYGASDFIEKPWRNESLVEKVQSLTRHVQQVRSSQRISDYEREDAQQLQTRIVPKRHLVTGGVEILGDSLPAGIVGGDYFGVWQPAPEFLHFCVADVSGKGTPGALIGAMLYASVTTLSSSSNSAETIIQNVEMILRDQLGEGHYVTVFYGVLNLKTHVLEFVNAGHCPPILRRANGTMQSLSPTRPVLGFMLDGGSSERVALFPGDRVVLYTDGITEPADEAGDEFGTDRLAEIVAQNPSQALQEQYHTILQKVRQHASGKFVDDATLVLVSVLDTANQDAGPNLP